MIVHILQMYRSKNHNTWNESLPYVQHNSNHALHSFTWHNPFEVFLGYQPLALVYVALLMMFNGTSPHAKKEVDKASRFVEKICHIQ